MLNRKLFKFILIFIFFTALMGQSHSVVYFQKLNDIFNKRSNGLEYSEVELEDIVKTINLIGPGDNYIEINKIMKIFPTKLTENEFEKLSKLYPAFNDWGRSSADMGNLSVFKFLVNKNPDLLKSTDALGDTPTHLAARRGNLEIIEYITKNYPDAVNATNKRNNTPAHLAARNGNLETVKILTDSYPELKDKLNEDQNNVGHLIMNYVLENKNDLKKVIKKFDEFTKYLAIDLSESMKTLNNEGKTPVDLALGYIHSDVLFKLAEANPSLMNFKDKNGNTPIFVLAKEKSRWNELNSLIDIAPEAFYVTNEKNESIINFKPPENLVYKLFFRNPEVSDSKGDHYACLSAKLNLHWNAIKNVIIKNPEILKSENYNDCKSNILKYAIEYGHLDFLKWVVNFKPNISDDNLFINITHSDKFKLEDKDLILSKLSKGNFKCVKGEENIFSKLINSKSNDGKPSSEDIEYFKYLAKKYPELCKDPNCEVTEASISIITNKPSTDYDELFKQCFNSPDEERMLALNSAIDLGNNNSIVDIINKCPECLATSDAGGKSPFYKMAHKNQSKTIFELINNNPHYLEIDYGDHSPYIEMSKFDSSGVYKLAKLNPKILEMKDNGRTIADRHASQGDWLNVYESLEINSNAITSQVCGLNPKEALSGFIKFLSSNNRREHYLYYYDYELEDKASFVAAKEGNLQLIKLIYEKNPNELEYSSSCVGTLPIHIAAKNHHWDIVDFLLEKFPNQATRKDVTGKIPSDYDSIWRCLTSWF